MNRYPYSIEANLNGLQAGSSESVILRRYVVVYPHCGIWTWNFSLDTFATTDVGTSMSRSGRKRKMDCKSNDEEKKVSGWFDRFAEVNIQI